MSDEITEPTVRLCWNDFAIRGAVQALRAANLDNMADDMEAQLKPAVEEPKAFGSIVRAGYDEHTDRVLWVRAGRGWFAETEHGFHSSFAGLHNPEVLRVGIGEPGDEEWAAAKYEATTALADAYSRGYHEGFESNLPSPIDRSVIHSAVLEELDQTSGRLTDAVMKALS